jgi:hypothetical protein
MVSDWGDEIIFWNILVSLVSLLLTAGLFGLIPVLIARSRDPDQSIHLLVDLRHSVVHHRRSARHAV